ncbi:hypothetical protein SBOR_1054 [Sclerotinia borealis F-4128]|uniref:Uncharacterized protein n=1 Tax=Sclerotinia borealis (strain F-4128) TaxID=1432307 RepID=W9CVG7_SCLBF|nr:hypothetical protein SBOR_1054 [Sclerotinia borealis F-4128]
MSLARMSSRVLRDVSIKGGGKGLRLDQTKSWPGRPPMVRVYPVKDFDLKSWTVDLANLVVSSAEDTVEEREVTVSVALSF